SALYPAVGQTVSLPMTPKGADESGVGRTVSSPLTRKDADEEDEGELSVRPTPGADLVITENGIKFRIDLFEGQKTGAFLDQRENRAAARRYARGRGLDCFSFHGSFALHMAKGREGGTSGDLSHTGGGKAPRK